MLRCRRIYYFLIVLFLSNPGGIDSFAREYNDIVKTTFYARAIGMGDAFTAVIDGATSALYNPASLGLYPFGDEAQISVYLNPVEAVVGLSQYRDLKQKNEPQGMDWLNLTGLFAKSILYHFSAFTAAATFTEQLPENPYFSEKNKPIVLDGLLDWNYHLLSTSLQLAKQISIGASGFIVTAHGRTQRKQSIGLSYGVMIQPGSKFTVGVSYFDFDSDIADLFLPDHRLVDETINVGISFLPWKFLLLSVDIKNASEDQRPLTREPHVGVELRPFSFAAIRGGYFRDEILKQDVFSCGISLFKNSLFKRNEQSLIFTNFLLNYAATIRRNAGDWDIRHYLSLNLKI